MTVALKEKIHMQLNRPSFSRLKLSTIACLALLLLSRTVAAQAPKPAKDENFTPGTDVSMGLMGQMTFARNPTVLTVYPDWTVANQQTQSQSPSAGALFTFHGAIKPYLGYNVNFSYTRFTQTDSEGSGYVPGQGSTTPPGGASFSAGALDSRMEELTLAYVFYGPRSKRFRTFGQIGGGGLFFEPLNANFAHQETRPAMVFGTGAEYDISSHFSVRAEYRGLFYKMPDFGIDNGFPKQRLFSVTNTPAISLVYRFKASATKQRAVGPK
jgi:opacity protein-like surface antigen